MYSNPAAVRQGIDLARLKFQQERATCLGGSDVVNLLDIAPYGCERQLAYDKLGIPADFPFEGNQHTERGTELEHVAARCYMKQTGRRLKKVPHIRHPDQSWIGAHIDRIVTGAEPTFVGRGVCELKCPTKENYLKIRSAGKCPEAYEWQGRWNMLASTLEWCSVAVFHPDFMKCLIFDFAGDEVFSQDLRVIGGNFWHDVKSGGGAALHDRFARKDPTCTACRKCPWRQTCQQLTEVPPDDGEQVEILPEDLPQDESLADLADAYLRLKGASKEATAAFEDIKKELHARLADRKGARCATANMLWKETDRRGYTVQPTKIRTLKVIPTHVLEEELL